MKTNGLLKVGALVVSTVAAVLAISVLLYNTEGKTKTTVSVTSLKDASALELPAVAAQIVAQASNEKRAEVAIETVRLAANLSGPGILPYVAGAICKNTPEVAPIVLSEAIKSKPEEVLPLAKASFAAAPNQIQELVKVACQARPDLFPVITRIAAQEAPNKADAIINGLRTGLPQLNSLIDKAMANVTPNTVAAVVDYVEKSAVAEAQTQQAENQKQQVIRALTSNNNSTDLQPMTIVEKAANANKEAKKVIASAEKSVASPSTAPANSEPRFSMGGPRIVPVPYVPPQNTLRPQDTIVLQPGAGRNYSQPSP